MSPADYGVVALFQVFITFLGAIFGFSVNGFCNIKYFELKDEQSRYKEYISNSVLLLLSMALLMSVIVTVIYFARQEIFGLEVNALFLLPLAFFSQYVIYIRLGVYQVSGKAKYYSLLNILNACFNILITLLFVVLLHYGYLGRLYGIVFSLFIVAIYSIYSLYRAKLLVFDFCPIIVKEIVRYGLSYAPNIVLVSLIPLLQRSVIATLLGANAVGIFMVSNQVSNGVLLILSSFITAYTPIVYRRLANSNGSSKLSKSLMFELAIYLGFLVLSASLLSTGILEAVLSVLLPENYHTAIPLAKLLILSILVKAGVMLFSIYPTYMKLNIRLSVITLFFGFFEILLIYLFLNSEGLIFVGYMAVAIKFAMLFLMLAFSYRLLGNLSRRSNSSV